ncbi:MAG TPA: hypothetical protein VJG48_01460 [Candidatus Paceibacterota bacterium]
MPGKKSKQGKQTITLDEFKRHTGALMERVDDGFKLTNEEMAGIHQKLDSHSHDIKGIRQVLDDHTQTLDSHTQMIGQLMTDVSDIKFELKKKVSYEDFAKLEKRVSRVEMRLRT